MKKQDFIKLGLDEELATKCAEASSSELENFTPKAKLEELTLSNQKLETDLKERNSQLEGLKNATGDIDSLKKTIEDLQTENKTRAESHATELHKIKVDNAVELALRNVSAINSKTVLPLLEGLDKAKFEEDGTVKGLSEQLEKLTAGENTSFLFKQASAPTFRGANIGESGNDESEQAIGSASTYDSIARMLEQNPNASLN